MENKLDSLIAKIKEKGIEEGEKKKKEIIAAAQKEAEGIIEQAKAESSRLKGEAQAQADKISQQARAALQQAKRDILLQLKEEIKAVCARLLEKEVASALDDDFIKEIIAKIVSAWQEDKEGKKIEIVLSQQSEALRDFILGKFKRAAAGGLEVTLNPQLEKGFYIKKEGEDFYYDFSQQALADILSSCLSPKINEILT